MNIQENINRFISGFTNPKQTIWLIFGGIFVLLFTSSIVWQFQDSDIINILPAIAFAALIIYLMFFNPRIWIYLICLLVFVFTRNTDNDLGATDIIVAAIYVGSVYFWIFFTILIKKERIILNFSDYTVLLFYILMLFNFILLVINDGDQLRWLRLFVIFSTLLVYFPFKHLIIEKRHLIICIILFGVSLLISGIEHLHEYYTNIYTEMVYVYQFGSSVHGDQSLFTSGCMLFLSLLIFQKKKIIQVLIILVFGLCLVSLIATFSRTFWIIVGFEIIILAFYLPLKLKMKLMLFASISIILFTSIMFLIFKNNVTYLYNTLEKRMVSSTEGKKDPSIMGRFYEYKSAVKQIEKYPLGGSGLGFPFNYYNALDQMNLNGIFIHNGYIFMSYSFGIPLALLFNLPILINLIKSHFITKSLKDDFYKPIAMSGGFIMLLIILADFSTTVNIMRDGIIMQAFGFAFISIGERESRKINGKSPYIFQRVILNPKDRS